MSFNASHTAIETMAIKMPKALQGIVDAGLDLSSIVASDLAQLPIKARQDLNNAFLYALKKLPNNPKLEQYKQLTTDEERRQAQVDFIIDTNAAVSRTGANISSVTVQKRNRERTVWLTQSQLASSTWLNDEGHAKIVAEDGRNSRPYKQSAALASAGVLEFEFTVEELDKMKTNTFTAEVRAEAPLEAEQYDAVKQAMDAQLNGDYEALQCLITPYKAL